MSEPTLRYVPRETPSPPTPQYDLAGTRQSQILGHYAARYPDGLTVAMAHMGVPGTISAQPLDLDDPEERAIVLDALSRAKGER